MRKRRRISRFSLADGQIVARAQQRGHEPGCEVELTEIRTSGQDWWTLGFEVTGPVGLPRSQLQATAAHVFAQALPGGVEPGRITPGPIRSGLASGQAPAMTPAPDRCPSAGPGGPAAILASPG